MGVKSTELSAASSDLALAEREMVEVIEPSSSNYTPSCSSDKAEAI
jgi:hypothetical protein